jgi:hypothetical protein
MQQRSDAWASAPQQMPSQMKQAGKAALVGSAIGAVALGFLGAMLAPQHRALGIVLGSVAGAGMGAVGGIVVGGARAVSA